MKLDRCVSIGHFKCMLEDSVAVQCSCFGLSTDMIVILCFYLTFLHFIVWCTSFLLGRLYFVVISTFSLIYAFIAKDHSWQTCLLVSCFRFGIYGDLTFK